MTQRRDGIRIYEVAAAPPSVAEVAERAHRLVMLVVGILAPVPAPSLRGALSLMAKRNPGLGPLAPLVATAPKAGELEREEVDGVSYLWPTCDGGLAHRPAPRDVRLLAPFDPVVWDRRRFEHLWGWAYRFEACTPPLKRLFGYYAMPLLWTDEVVGWANVSSAAGKMQVEIGYARRPPQSIEFRRALDVEFTKTERFLKNRDTTLRNREHAGLFGEELT